MIDQVQKKEKYLRTYCFMHFECLQGQVDSSNWQFLSGATLFQVQIWPATSRVDSRKWPENLWKVLMYLNFIDGKRPRVKFWYIWNILCMYRISSYSFRGNYSFLDSEIQKSQYIKPKVTVHKCAETIQGRELFKGGNYMRKYGNWN